MRIIILLCATWKALLRYYKSKPVFDYSCVREKQSIIILLFFLNFISHVRGSDYAPPPVAPGKSEQLGVSCSICPLRWYEQHADDSHVAPRFA